jgi:hypothetical protein
MEKQRKAIEKLQDFVLCWMEEAERREHRNLVTNPHLWATEDRKETFYKPEKQRDRPWTLDWQPLLSFLEQCPEFADNGGDASDFFRLGYHGTRNTYRVTCILEEGLKESHRRVKRSAFFGVNLDAVKQYGEPILFLLLKSKMGGVRGDGAFGMEECFSLPVGYWQRPSRYSFSDLFLDQDKRKQREKRAAEIESEKVVEKLQDAEVV